MEFWSALKDLLVGLLLVLSLVLSGIGFLSYRRSGSPRLLMVSIAFVLFLMKGIYLALGLYLLDWVSVPRGFALAFDIMLLVDVAVLMTLYLALFRKKRV